MIRTTRLLISVYLFTLIGAPLAQADLASPSPSGAAADCNSFCSMLVNGKGKPIGLDGSGAWGTSDDQWCANHNAQTNPAVQPQSTPSTSASAPAGTCNIQLQPGDTSCADNQRRYAHCTYHNGQAEQQCEAYVAADGGTGGEKAVLFLDIAATGTCAASCAMKTNPALATACRAAGTGASAMELLETLTQKGSAVGKLLSGGMAGYSLYNNGKALLAKPAAANGANGATAKKPGDGDCTSAMLFAAMTIFRHQAIKSQGDTKKNACDAVKKLASNALVVGGSAVVSFGSNGSLVSSASGGDTGSLSSGADSSLRCVSNGGAVSSCTGTTGQAATDAGMLTDSGLGSHLAPQAQQLADSPLGRELGEGRGDPMAALGAATSGAGEAGGAVMTVAAAAQEEAKRMAEGVQGATFAGGGGGGAPEAAAAGGPSPLDALNALLHGGKAEGASAVGGTQVFGATGTDIWHTKTDQNLFQIVSGRIEKAATRLK